MKLIVLFFVLAAVIAIQAAPTEEPSEAQEYTTLSKGMDLRGKARIARDLVAIAFMPWLIPELWDDYKKGRM